MKWEVLLFGSARIAVDGVSIPLPRTRKSVSLLALLILNADQSVDRVTLAERLWPDSSAETGAVNLRQTLAILRRSLGAVSCQIEAPSKKHLRLNTTNLWCDVLAFDTAIRRGEQEEAADLYRGAFLVEDNDDWLVPERLRREQACLNALMRLSQEAHDPQKARTWAERAAVLAPLDETVQRRLYETLADEGNLAAAKVAFHRFRKRLWQETQQSPAPETLACIEALTNRNAVPTRQAVPTLPLFLTPFIGRTKALTELREAVSGPNLRLITLLGPGGMGKTRLAVELARELTPQPVPFVDLSALSITADTESIYNAIAAALGLRLFGTLTAKRAIQIAPPSWLLLDNAETVQSACARVAQELLISCPELRILVTSRHVLGVPGEIRWNVPPLSHADASALFRIRADAIRPGLPLSDPDIATLCEKLEGIPLALELAAGRLSMLSARQLREGLDRQRLRVLKNTHAIPGRHSTLQATLEDSWNLLSPQQQTVLAQLSIFAGGWTPEAAQEIVSPKSDEWETIDLLESLVNCSLITVRGDRSFLLETVREFACTKLTPENKTHLRERHARYFLALAMQDKELGQLSQERDNLYTTLEQVGPETALPLFVALGEFFLRLGHFSMGRHFASKLLGSTPNNHPSRPWALYEAGRLAQAQNDWSTAQSLFKQGIESAGSDLRIRTRLLGNLGLLARERGDLVEAAHCYETAVRWAAEQNDNGALVTLRIRLAILAEDRGDSEGAFRRFNELLATLPGPEDDGTRGIVLGFLGGISLRRGNTRDAVAYFEQALPLHERYEYQSEIARVCLGLGRALTAENAPAKAHAFLIRARQTYQQLGDTEGEHHACTALNRLGIPP